MKISIKYFGKLSELSGKTEEFIDVEENITVLKLTELLQNRHPKLKENIYQVIRNLNKCNTQEKINEGDEIALLPQFSGG